MSQIESSQGIHINSFPRIQFKPNTFGYIKYDPFHDFYLIGKAFPTEILIILDAQNKNMIVDEKIKIEDIEFLTSS